MKRAIATIAVGVGGDPRGLGGVRPGDPQQRQAEGLPDLRLEHRRLPASASPTRRATGPASTSTSAAPSRRRSSTTRPRCASSRSRRRTASRRCSRARSTCSSATRPGRCRATPSSASTSRPSTTTTARASWSARSSASPRPRSSTAPRSAPSRARRPSSTSPTSSAPTTMKYEVVAFATADETFKAYDAGRCDAFTTDASGLYSERLQGLEPGRPHRAAGDHLQGAARPGRAPRRQPVGRHRPLDPLRACSTPRSSASPRPTSTRC